MEDRGILDLIKMVELLEDKLSLPELVSFPSGKNIECDNLLKFLLIKLVFREVSHCHTGNKRSKSLSLHWLAKKR